MTLTHTCSTPWVSRRIVVITTITTIGLKSTLVVDIQSYVFSILGVRRLIHNKTDMLFLSSSLTLGGQRECGRNGRRGVV